jgi:hypothetical protein
MREKPGRRWTENEIATAVVDAAYHVHKDGIKRIVNGLQE